MLRRRSLVPRALLDQARACVEASAQAARFFRRPSEAGAFAAHEAGRAARRSGEAAVAALTSGTDPRRQDWLVLSRSLAEVSSEAAASAVEGQRFGLAGIRDLAALAAGLRGAAQDLVAALDALGDGRRCQELVVSAKRRAAEAERLNRLLREAALDGPGAVLDLKVRTVLGRLGRSAEACQKAADRIAEVLGILS